MAGAEGEVGVGIVIVFGGDGGRVIDVVVIVAVGFMEARGAELLRMKVSES